MVTKKELYISLSPQVYRSGKLNVLHGQADSLRSLKSLRNLAILERQKIDLKKSLRKSISTILSEIDSLEEKLPSAEVPEIIEEKKSSRKTSKKRDTEKAIEKEIKRKDYLDEELKQIQEKLQALNA